MLPKLDKLLMVLNLDKVLMVLFTEVELMEQTKLLNTELVMLDTETMVMLLTNMLLDTVL